MDHQHSRQFGFFYHLILMWRAAFAMRENAYLKRFKAMNLPWRERIMLAVTQVNKCAMCSWMHTNIALGAGMKDEEIKSILQGDYSTIPNKELTSILYAQDYASRQEKKNQVFAEKVINQYGKTKARAIDNVIAIITMTNSMGIQMALLKDTFTFKHQKGSNFFREFFVPLITMIVFPFLFLIAAVTVPVYVRFPSYRQRYL
jgi:AhpD family alkylhydroperoxidase